MPHSSPWTFATALPLTLSLGVLASGAIAQGSLEPVREMIPPSAATYWSSCLADIDGDGALDFVWMQGSLSGDLQVHRNDGRGRFDPEAQRVGPVATSAIAAGDFDGDGDTDLVSGKGDFFRNVGGTLLLVRGALAGANGEVAVGDFDGDGDLDAFVFSWPSQSFFRNDGTGVFTSDPAALPPLVFAGSPQVFDADQDGIDDVVLLGAQGFGSPPARLHLWLGTPNGFVDASGLQGPVPASLVAGAFGDVDRDGDVDLFLNAFGGLIEIRLNDGAGRFVAAPGALPAIPEDPHDAAMADLDGDGDLDLLLATGRADPNARSVVLLNNGAGVFARGAGGELRRGTAYRCLVGDLDGDADVDAVLATGFGHRVLANKGGAEFVEPSALPFTDRIGDLCVLDWNGDSAADLVVAVLDGSGVRLDLLENRGDGTFTDPGRVVTPQVGPWGRLQAADLDGDGNDDLIAYGTSVRMFRSAGGGVFTDITAQLIGSAISPGALAIDDMDADGDQDLVLGTRIYFNDGAGNFPFSPPLLPAVSRALANAVGDFDGDGDLDVFVSEEDDPITGPRPARLFQNNGGAFTEVASLLPPTVVGPGWAKFGDLDGDGREDLVVERFSTVEVYWSDPTGLSVGPTFRLLPGVPELVDFDGDGIVDLLLSHQVYAGHRSRTLVQSSSLPTDLRVSSVWPADFDQDGDLDIVGRVGNHPVLFTNTRRQLARLGPFRVGRTGELAVFGDPGRLIVLAAAFQRLPAPIPVPIGPGAWLDPAGATILAVAAMGPTGRAVWSTPIPAINALPTIYAQAVLIGTGGIETTNLEVLELQRW